MRDKIKDKKYFEEYVNKEVKSIDFFIENTKGKELPEAGKRTLNVTLDKHLRNYFLGSYSLGEEIKNLVEIYINSVSKFTKSYNKDSFYVQMIWMLSIGIMLEIENTNFNKLVQLVEKDNPNDFLIDFLINSKKHSWGISHSTFKFETPYKSLAEVINLSKTDKQKAVERLKHYLDKEWYKGHSDTGWYDSHKSKHNIYSGYWCWESGALVKILGLDDTILKDQQYYPYDMVHWSK